MDPLGTLATVDDVIAAQVPHVTAEHDFALTWLYLAKTMLLSNLGRTQEAPQAVRAALSHTLPSAAEHPTVVATTLWCDHLAGRPPDPSILAVAQRYLSAEIGFELTLRVAHAMAAPTPVAQRALALCAIANRRPLGRWHQEESEVLVAFGHLAFEEGDLSRARRIARATAFRNPPTIVAATNLLAKVEGWEEQTWVDNLVAATVERTSSGVLALTTESSRMLAEELRHWGERFDPTSGGHSPCGGASRRRTFPTSPTHAPSSSR